MTVHPGARKDDAAGLLRRALPTLREAFAGSVLWAAGMALAAIVSLGLGGWIAPGGVAMAGLLFASGGGLAFAPALYLARLFSAGRRTEARLAAGLVSFGGSTVLFTAFVYGLHHRLTFEEQHSPPFTLDWLAELAFTFAAAFYRFALFGVRLYLPIGLLFLFAIALWHARRSR